MRTHQNQTYPEKKKVKFIFQLELIQILLRIPHDCKVFVQWGRKNTKLKSRCLIDKIYQNNNELYKISTQQKMVYEQKLYLIAGEKLNSYQNPFEDRQNFIRVILEKNGQQKLGGSLVFNVSNAIQGNSTKGSHFYQLRLENSPDFSSYLKFLIHYQVVQEIKGLDTCSFRLNSPSSISKSPNIKKHLQSYQKQFYNRSPRNMSHLTSQQFDGEKQYNESYRRQTEQKINQLIASITGFKNQLHIKAKEVQMLRYEDRLKTEEIQRVRIETNQKVLGLMEEINQLQEENKREKQENGRLVVEIQRLKLEMIRSEKVKERLDQENFELNKKCDSLSNKYSEEIELLKNQNERIKFELFESQYRIFKLQSDYQNVQNKNSQIYQQTSNKLQNLQYQKITLTRKNQQLEQRLIYYEQNKNELENKLKVMSVEKQVLARKLIKVEKAFEKEQGFSKSAYKLLEDQFREVSRQLVMKEQILESIELNHKNNIRLKDEEIDLMRKKFNSFIDK